MEHYLSKLIILAIAIIVFAEKIRHELIGKEGECVASLRKRLFDLAPGAIGMLFALQLFWIEVLAFDAPESLDTIIKSSGICLGVIAAVLIIWPHRIRRTTWAGPTISPDQVPDHFLVTWGPYRYIRHPYYAGCLLGIFAFELTAASWLAFVVTPFAAWAAQVNLDEEERQLERKYGCVYKNYKDKSWRLFPLIY